MTHPELDISTISSSRNPHSGRLAAVESRELSGQLDILRSRMCALNGRDKGLMEMYLAGASFRQMACLGGVNEATVARKVGKIIKRLMSSTYITCLRNRQQLGEAAVAIGRDYLVGGMSHHDVAKKHEVSLYHVKKVLAKIRDIK